MKLLISMIKKRRVLCIITFCLMLVSIGIVILWNSSIGGIIDFIVIAKAIETKTIIITLLILLSNGIIVYAMNLMSGYTCEMMNSDLRMGFARKTNNKSIQEMEIINSGEHLSKLQNEISEVSSYISNNLFNILNDAVRFIATITYFIMLSPMLTLSTNLPVVIILIYIFYSSKVISHATQESQIARTQLNSFSDTLLNLFPIIKVFNASNLVIHSYNNGLVKWEKFNIKSERTKAKLMSLSGFMSQIPLLLLMLIGGYMVIKGNYSIGIIYIFLNLSGNVSGVMMNMSSYISAYRQFIANVNRIEPEIQLSEVKSI